MTWQVAWRCGLISLLTLLLGAPLLGLAAEPETNDIDIVIARLTAAYLEEGSVSDAADYLKQQRSNGSWSDITYTDRSKNDWEPSEHLRRLYNMAIAYHKDVSNNDYYHSAVMRAGVLKGLDYWYAIRPESDNWWWNEIGQQQKIGPILILMREFLQPTQLNSGVEILDNDRSGTGQNKVWLAVQWIWKGCLLRSSNHIHTGMADIASTFVFTTAEGIQSDYSFHQHGNILYNAGYGLSFIQDTVYWATMMRDTTFAFSPTEINLLSGLLLDGDGWMVRGKTIDYSADGREISRKNQTAADLVDVCAQLEALDPARAKELWLLRAHILWNYGPPIQGNKYFWRSDFMAHQRAKFYASVKLISAGQRGTESANSENLKGYWLPFGLTFIMRRGDEYQDIFPLWDWAKLPGVTAPDTVPALADITYQSHAETFVGGASDGAYGVAGMRLNKDGTQGVKAWFFFDDEMVALGSDITSNNSHAINTALNQCLLNGAVQVDGATQSAGTHTLNSVSWVYHDQVGYVFPNRATVQLKNDWQSGNWDSINKRYSTETVKDEVFKLWITHGAHPSHAQYQYIVVPGVNAAGLATYAAHPPVRVLANSRDLQAVRHDRLRVSELVFHAAGAAKLRDGLTVTVDRPCFVVVKESDYHVQVTVASPETTTQSVHVRLREPQRTHSFTFTLPVDAAYVGSSVTQRRDVGGEQTRLVPLADAYVRGGEHSATNYGANVELPIKAADAAYDRRSYLQFGLGDVSNVITATLRLYARTLWSGATTATLHTTENTWSEMDLTYDNAPPLGSLLQSRIISQAGAYYEWDVSDYVRSKLAAGQVSLGLYSSDTNGMAFYSRETAHPPELYVMSSRWAWYSRPDEAAVYELDHRYQGEITIKFDLTPLEERVTGLVAYAAATTPLTDAERMAMQVRLSPEGRFEACNAGAYSADWPMTYTLNLSYHVYIATTLISRTYDVWVMPDPWHAFQIANDYTFCGATQPEYLNQIRLSSPTRGQFKVENHSIAAGPAYCYLPLITRRY